MNSFLDKLCLKRLCLPSNIDINLIRNSSIKHSDCACDTSKHIAVCFKNGNILNVLSYGTNVYDNGGSVGTIHAEMKAIYNLQSHSPNKKHLIKLDILVIRTSNIGKIGMSKPCFKCILDLSTIPQKKGYIIKNIYYSNNDGDLVKTTLKSLINNKDFHISRYYLNHGFKHDLLKK